jgi:hypothetical protein
MKSMQVTEQQEGRCRNVYWSLPDQGWEDLACQIDSFLASAIQAIAKEYAADPVEWLVINHWPDSGRLIVYPAQDGPCGNRGERIYLQIRSSYLEDEFRRITETLTDSQVNLALGELADKVWERVGECLRHGQASRHLAEARKVHWFRLAMFDYNFGESPFRLTELDEEAAAEMKQELIRTMPWLKTSG